MIQSTQKELYEYAKTLLPGGVNSSTRLNQAIGMPFYVSKGSGSRVWDVEGREYIDMCCAHGAGLLGNGHPAIDEALQTAARIGYVNALETEYHIELARLVCECIPCAERVRFCSSGSEATLHLIRVCRAFTGKNKIIRIEGHFHGYHELIYIGGHPPQDKFPHNRKQPYIESPGIPGEFAKLIIPIPFNDKKSLTDAIEQYGEDTALIILEPVNYNCGCIKPAPGYLEFVREIASDSQIILFFDEIQSAFKKSKGGAQEDYGVIPDVCTIGKSLGGGLPLSAFCGRAEIMDLYQPVGPVQHSGTFNAHLVPILAGLAFMTEMCKEAFFQKLQTLEKYFHDRMEEVITSHDLNISLPNHGARFNILLGRKTPAQRYEDTFCHDNKVFLKILKACWQRGIYFHDYGGAPVHHGYSVQHSTDEIDTVASVLETVFKDYRDELIQIK